MLNTKLPHGDILDAEIDILELRIELALVLKKMGIANLRALVDNNMLQLAMRKGISQSGAWEIQDALQCYGLHLRVGPV